MASSLAPSVGLHPDSTLAAPTPPTSLPAEFVEDITASLRQLDNDRLRAVCVQMHDSHWHHDDRVYLEETHRGTEINGLAKLVALTAIPHVAKTLRKLLLDVSGPRATQDDLLSTSLQTKPVLLGWQAKLSVPWVDLGDDKLAVEQMAELALTKMMESLSLVKARPRFLIAYDRGWEASSDTVIAGHFKSRNCDILLTPFLSAWAKTWYRVQHLEVVGDAGCAPVDSISALGKGDITAYATLRHLDLDLSQRDTTQPPFKLFKLLGAARGVEILKLRWNLTPTIAPDGMKALQAVITRSHGIKDVKLHGLHCSAADIVGLLKRYKATSRTHKLARVEISDVCLTDCNDETGWDEVLAYLAKAFDMREVRLSFLCGNGLGVWCLRGVNGHEAEFAAEGREEVRGLLEMLQKEGRWVKQQAGEQGRQKLR